VEPTRRVEATDEVVAVGRVDDVPVGAVKRQCERYRKTYKLVPALAAGDKCKVVVKTACFYKRHIYSRWAMEHLIFSLVPIPGFVFKQGVAVARCTYA
jgi:hypothetical protein